MGESRHTQWWLNLEEKSLPFRVLSFPSGGSRMRTERDIRRPLWRSTSFRSPFRDPGVPDKDLAQLFSGLGV